MDERLGYAAWRAALGASPSVISRSFGGNAAPVADVTSGAQAAVKKLLVVQACTRVALLLGTVVAVAAIVGLGLRWYIGLVWAWFGVLLVGAALKLVFAKI